jgi:tetratricopeptide (TPR) repeat protein
LFFYWVQNAIFDATQADNKGHIYYSDQEYSKAYNSFYKAAILSENKLDKSREYRCAANAAHAQNDIDKTLDMISLSLKYNETNQNAIALLKVMLNQKQITKKDIKRLGVHY